MRVVLNLDDLSDATGYILSELDKLNAHFPYFKITLFGIPVQMGSNLLASVKDRGYIQVAMHGWSHPNNWECHEWHDKNEILRRLDFWRQWSEFHNFLVRGFKGPGWWHSQELVDVINDCGWWLAVNPENPSFNLKVDRPYVVDYGLDNEIPKDWPVLRLHGHMQNVVSGNGLIQCLDKILELPREAEFLFIDEVMHG